MDIDNDLEFISNSLRMLPPWDWDEGVWWPKFGELSGIPKAYLTEKIAWITAVWLKTGLTDREAAGERATYVLMLFDNPALYEHLDEVADTWEPPVPGGTGRRWSEGICAAAWRVLVAVEPDNVHSHNFAVPGF